MKDPQRISCGSFAIMEDGPAKVEEREARRGRLLCAVHVMVYENDAIPSVGFPPPAAFDAETHPDQIKEAVSRAKDALEDWR